MPFLFLFPFCQKLSYWLAAVRFQDTEDTAALGIIAAAKKLTVYVSWGSTSMPFITTGVYLASWMCILVTFINMSPLAFHISLSPDFLPLLCVELDAIFWSISSLPCPLGYACQWLQPSGIVYSKEFRYKKRRWNIL